MKELKYNHLFHRELAPFERIISKDKKFEIRLNDEKRQKVKIWDIVKWVLKDDETRFFISEITWLSYFKTFEELYYSFEEKIPDIDKEILSRVYKEKQVKKYWIVLMHFKLIYFEN